MALAREYRAALRTGYADYWTWLGTRETALSNIFELSERAASRDWTTERFLNEVQKLDSWTKWQSTVVAEGDTGDTVTEIGDEPFKNPVVPFEPSESFQAETRNLLASFEDFLRENELPGSLIEFIKTALADKKPSSQIIAELRQTPEYKLAYPENDLRRQRGLSWMAESEIRAYRDEAKRLSREYMNVDATNAEVAELIGRGTSLRQWEHRLQIDDLVQRWGGSVQAVFEGYTGAPLSAERLQAFMDPEFATPDLDRVYELALIRGQPAELGFAIRPEEEAQALQAFGLSPEDVFKGFKQARSEIPRFERLAAIANYVKGPGSQFFGDVSVPGQLLLRAIQFGDPEAVRELQRLSSTETARFQAAGGPARRGAALTGLAPL